MGHMIRAIMVAYMNFQNYGYNKKPFVLMNDEPTDDVCYDDIKEHIRHDDVKRKFKKFIYKLFSNN